MTRQIEIHEFSTGIAIETKADGSWFLKGFMEGYMNQTIDPIPYPIQEAISNRLFAIAEGASSDTPAIIGREVGSQGEIWSVVAVVIKVRDKTCRFSAYRYFCVEGKGYLNQILRFWKENPLQFNPLDEKTIGNPHLFTDNYQTKIPLDNFQDLLTQSIPVIVPCDRASSPIIINAIVEEMAGENVMAWAYNVQALDKPASFYVIKPHDEKAEAIIRKSLTNQVITNRPIFDEQKIKTAVTSLCKRNKIKVEYIKTLEEALSNQDINDTFWQSIFDGQGLKQAKSQGIYNDEMTRLFTLQGLILPHTLPDFLTWIKDIKRDDLLIISNNFQYDILKILTHEFRSEYLIERIELGIILIIPYLLKNESLIEQVINLLKTEKSLWGYYYINRISKEIDHDLKLMKQYAKQKELNDNFQIFNEDSWIDIKDELAIAWGVPPNSNRFKPIPKYKIWVRLFDGLNESKFALFFAHFAYDKVPKDIFSKVKKISFGSHYHCKIYDVITTREVGGIEKFILELNELLKIEADYNQTIELNPNYTDTPKNRDIIYPKFVTEIEKKINTAIKGLTRRAKLKGEHIEIIENILANPNLDNLEREIWNKSLNGNNTKRALEDKIYSPEMVKLLTLRAIILPDTLPEFLMWLDCDNSKDNWIITANFQQEILNLFRKLSEQLPNISQKTENNIISIIPKLIDNPNIAKSLGLLLAQENGIWGHFYQSRLKLSIDHDLSLIKDYKTEAKTVSLKLINYPIWKQLFDDIKSYWYNESYDQKYLPLAEFFESTKDWNISALFFHIAKGKVPKKVFNKIVSDNKDNDFFSNQVYALKVTRIISWWEWIFWIPFFIIIRLYILGRWL